MKGWRGCDFRIRYYYVVDFSTSIRHPFCTLSIKISVQKKQESRADWFYLSKSRALLLIKDESPFQLSISLEKKSLYPDLDDSSLSFSRKMGSNDDSSAKDCISNPLGTVVTETCSSASQRCLNLALSEPLRPQLAGSEAGFSPVEASQGAARACARPRPGADRFYSSRFNHGPQSPIRSPALPSMQGRQFFGSSDKFCDTDEDDAGFVALFYFPLSLSELISTPSSRIIDSAAGTCHQLEDPRYHNTRVDQDPVYRRRTKSTTWTRGMHRWSWRLQVPLRTISAKESCGKTEI